MPGFRRVGTALMSFGFDPRMTWRSLRFIPRYIVGCIKYFLLSNKSGDGFGFTLMPVLSDCGVQAGAIGGHYFSQDLWMARRVFSAKPKTHIDVGSRLDGFVTHLLTFMEVTVGDVRNLDSTIEGLHFVQLDLMKNPPAHLRSDSVSCLHALEHFGLGRYGDPINVNGWKDGLMNLSKMINPGGVLYLSVPIGNQRVEFNAHRIFNKETIINEAGINGLELREFALIDNMGKFTEHSGHCDYCCGLFVFQKPSPTRPT